MLSQASSHNIALRSAKLGTIFASQKVPESSLGKTSQAKSPIARIGLFAWWLLPDLNWGHEALQASALPAELKSHTAVILSEKDY